MERERESREGEEDNSPPGRGFVCHVFLHFRVNGVELESHRVPAEINNFVICTLR